MAARRLIVALGCVVAALIGSCQTPGLPRAEHFALTGAHRDATCASCHLAGLEVTLPTSCSGCHQPDEPPDHHDGECSSCHNTTSWADATFDHSTLPPGTACSSCHLPDRPTPHADGECSDCHTTTSWQDTSFDHSTLTPGTTCTSCHLPDRPTPHAEGDCSECHTTISWTDVQFDHSTLTPGTTCTSCHSDDRPPAHFAGDCAACHNTNDWADATFDHADFFPLPHRGVSACVACHPEPQGTAAFMCLNCHEHRRAETDPEHRGMANYAYDSVRCLACHPDGRD
jgi:hypothetical protein